MLNSIISTNITLNSFMICLISSFILGLVVSLVLHPLFPFPAYVIVNVLLYAL